MTGAVGHPHTAGEIPGGAPGGEPTHAERLARGAVLQQTSQILRLAGGFVVVTLLARTLSLSEFGTYTLVLSQLTYVIFVKNSVTNAAVIGVSNAGDDEDALTGVVSTGFAIYAVIGAISGAVLAGVGLAVLPLLNVRPGLYDDAQLAVVVLAGVTAISWPAQIFDDALRGMQRFAAVSAVEIAGMVAFVAGAVVMMVLGAPVAAFVGWNAAIPLVAGAGCFVALRFTSPRPRIRLSAVHRSEARRFGSLSGLLLLGGVADLVTYSVDRFLLAALRSPTAVGLYEAPLGAQNMIRYLNGVMTATVIPASARYHAERDENRTRELFVAGLRYTLATTVPFVLVITILPELIITAWLGEKFRSMSSETAVFTSWWLIGAHSGMVGTMLLTAGKVRQLVTASWLVAVINVALTAVLTSEFGIWGPIIGSMTALMAALLWTLPLAVRTLDVRWADIARRAWLPAYSTGAGLAVILVGLRSFGLNGPVDAILVLAGAAALYWSAYAVFWLRPDERRLLLTVLRRR